MKLPQEIIDDFLDFDGGSIESLLQLDDFVHSIFTFDLPKSYFILLIASCAWIALLILCGLPIFIVRILKKKVWFIRFIRRQEGVYIVPNAITSFVICITIFGICWILTCTMEVIAYMMKYDILQNALPTMQILCWWPLLSAISCVAWGSFFSIGSLDSPKILHRCIPRPLILSILCLGSPFLVGVIQVPLAICTEVALRKNLQTYHNFHQRVLKVVDDELIKKNELNAKESKELFAMAMTTLNRHKKAATIYRISYAFWSILSSILLIFYAIVGYQLTVRLYQKMRQHYLSLQPSERCQESSKPWHSLIYWKKIKIPSKVKRIFSRNSKDGIIPRVERRHDSLRFYAYDQEMIGNANSYFDHPRSLSPFHRLSESDDKTEVPAETFVRSTIPELQNSTPTTFHTTIHQGTQKERMERYKYAHRCWISLTILYLSILMALSIFTSISILWSMEIVSVVNKGPIAISKLYEKTHLVSAWTCVIFGTSAAFSIISRIFDPTPESIIQIKQDQEQQLYKRENDNEDSYLTAMQVILSPSTTLQPSIHSVQNHHAKEAVAMESIGLSYFSIDADDVPQNKSKRLDRGSVLLSCDNLDRLDRLEEYTDLNSRHTT